MPNKIKKIDKESLEEETVKNVRIDYAASNTVRKTLEMAEILRKYPRGGS